MTLQDGQIAYASPEEVALAFAALNAADLVRLARLAQIRARSVPGCEWEDLLQEAIGRALDGSRRWPSHIPLAVFLREVMRSLVSEIRRKARYDDNRPDADDGETHRWEQIASDGPDPERILAARDMLTRVAALFANDAEALAILNGLADGRSPSEIQETTHISATNYDSTRRRIRRTVARAFPEKI